MQLTLNKYDRILWRVVGTLLLLVALLGGASLAFLLAQVFGERRHRAHDAVAVDERTKTEEFLRLGYFQPLEGTDFVLIPLSAEGGGGGGSLYSRVPKSTNRNYLLFNARTKESRWIWPSHASLIRAETYVYDRVGRENGRHVTGILFERTTEDTNGNGRLDDEDRAGVEYYVPGSGRRVPVVADIERVIGIQQLRPDEVIVFYSRAGKSAFVTLNTASLAVSAPREIVVP
jgi:hypothetical protein